ncbi:hypothetical protein BDV96DRAFT_639948 [Lophiotrema nucula]|uniref:FAD-binding domain-containing protein n=1 Tax=Lophiotrema nucula TaxID=690887 RepID=A0A6A5ZSN1_9PLEO|nr:hypothetical protein BDV96DRAFT_639948 [Lophiotrema nucula]
MEYYRDEWKLAIIPEKKLNAILISAGIAGLATGIALRQSGHHVTILEQVLDIAEVGAGIQMPPNSTRILARWEVLDKLSEHINFMEANSLRSWKDDTELGRVLLMPGVADHYGAPLGVIHGGDLQRILLAAAVKSGCEIRTNHKVVKVDDNFEARIQLLNGEWMEGDVVIAADGIKSVIRNQIAAAHKHLDRATPTGDAAYRFMIPKENMSNNKEALNLMSTKIGMRWLDAGGHIVAYPVKNAAYNMVPIHPGKT